MYRMVLDTETTGGFDKPLFYDIGFTIYKGRKMEPIVSYSFVNSDIYDKPLLMKDAYYACKIPLYEERLANHTMVKLPLYEIRKVFLNAIQKYHIKKVYAYNASFDDRAMSATMEYCTNGRFKFFLPKGVKMCDIWACAGDVILPTKAYSDVALANGWVSDHGNIKTSAETVYRYITGQYDFEEKHTGIEDTHIEADILRYCLSKKWFLNEKPGSYWQVAQKFNPTFNPDNPH